MVVSPPEMAPPRAILHGKQASQRCWASRERRGGALRGASAKRGGYEVSEGTREERRGRKPPQAEWGLQREGERAGRTSTQKSRLPSSKPMASLVPHAERRKQ